MKMYQYKVGAIIVFSLLSGTLQGANEMNVSEQKKWIYQRVEAFKHEIGIGAFQNAEKTLPQDEGVVLQAQRNILEFLLSTNHDWYYQKGLVRKICGSFLVQANVPSCDIKRF